MTDSEDTPGAADVFRDFALACRQERDRIALARLAADDRRFASASLERAAADGLALQIIRAAASR